MNSIDILRALPGRIAFANYSKNNDLGGVTTWLEALLLRLHDDGVPVSLLLHHYDKEITGPGIWSTLRNAGIPVEIIPASIEEENANPRRFARGTLEFLNRYASPVFLPNCRNGLYFAAQIAGRQGVPWAFTIHSDEPLFWNVAKAISVISSSGVFVGVSRYVGQQVIQQGLAKHSSVIPHGVPLSEKRTSFSDAPFKVAYSGRIIEEQKRISLVLRTMALACRQDHRLECWLIGDGPEAESSQAWVREQGLTDRIFFTGRLEVQEVRKRISQFQAVLLMSDYEGLGISLLEAMACGVVPVARRIQPITEFVKNNETGLLVDAIPEHAANALIRLIDDPELWLRCSQAAARLVADEYSDQKSYDLWVDFLADLCQLSTVVYPLSIPKRAEIPLRYEPILLRLTKAVVSWKWRFTKLWYQWILPVAAFPGKFLPLLRRSGDV
jgi:glycosyltransferase involved in cell wall biosynthesis